ncbi:MAG: UTP--glucose-1-phosphate uridylyltransferase [Clostridia bacterium]|nr:UTP--glucose-1-phosphate uridylyltransferase [Clostridia bacterium]
MKNIDEMREYLKKYDAEYLLNFYDELNDSEKEGLINQIKQIDFKYMKELYNTKAMFNMEENKITSIPAIDKNKLNDDTYEKSGIEEIKAGRLAVCSMAGGQGTRLGFNGPKGTYMLELDKPTSIFETIVIKLKEAYEKYGVLTYWYVMTSEQNDKETQKFFENNNFFGYDKEHIVFFKQGELPLLDTNGKVVLKDKADVFMAADGNGGIFRALGNRGIIAHMKEHGIKYLAIGNVDNILIHMVDPIAVGLMKENNMELLSKSFMKPTPEGKWGVFCKVNGKPRVIEYIETPRELLEARNEEGELIYGDAHFGCNYFDVELLEKIVTEKLPMHAALKKNKGLNSDGEIEEMETYKFEAFIFDGFSMAEDIIVFRVNRNDEFAPIKNKEGEETPESAIKLYKEFYKKED